VKDNLGYFCDDEYDKINWLIYEIAKEMKILSYFEQTQESPPDLKQLPEFNSYDDFIEH